MREIEHYRILRRPVDKILQYRYYHINIRIIKQGLILENNSIAKVRLLCHLCVCNLLEQSVIDETWPIAFVKRFSSLVIIARKRGSQISRPEHISGFSNAQK